MRWTNSSRLLVCGTTLLALIMVLGTSNNRPQMHEAPTGFATRLPTKSERLSGENSNIAKVAFQFDEDDNGFQQPAQSLDCDNELRNWPLADQATSLPSQRKPEDFEPNFQSGNVGEKAQPADMVAPRDDNTATTAQAGRSSNLPANWQANPMFDQPMSESNTDDGSVIKIGSEPSEKVARRTVVAKQPAIEPASRPLNSPPPQYSTTKDSKSSVNARSQPAATYNSQSPVGFSISESVAQKAAYHIEYGKSLSRRGATYAARQEFYEALQLIAQAIDADLAEPTFTKALCEALTALREASDFYVNDSESQIGLNTAVVVETHTSKVVTIDEARSSTAIELMRKYYSFAEERLILASGHHVVAAEALYCLGKLHSVMSKHDAHADQLDIAKAMVYHRACLECDPSNYRSANELGTLLARNGQLADAKEMLKRSLLIKQTPQAWKNLAIVHERIGETDLAELANQEYLLITQADLSNEIPSLIQWIDPGSFNGTAPLQFHESTARQSSPLPDAPATEAVKPKSEKLIDKVKKWF